MDRRLFLSSLLNGAAAAVAAMALPAQSAAAPNVVPPASARSSLGWIGCQGIAEESAVASVGRQAYIPRLDAFTIAYSSEDIALMCGLSLEEANASLKRLQDADATR